MNLVRTFIAAELSAELLKTLYKLQRALRDAPGGTAVNWVRLEGIHLTFKFLGDVPSDALPHIYAVIEQVCANYPPFVVQVSGLGCFPNMVRPRVVWVGLQDVQQQLQRIKQVFENELASSGYSREDRVFQPHLTLGRVRSGALSPEVDILGRTISGYESVVLGEIHVSQICAIASTLSPAGAIYRILNQSPLVNQRKPSGDEVDDASTQPASVG
ncbi:MAG: RNA 2',3'-cyclic phosphodiesterase [Anaerolineae bacterium]